MINTYLKLILSFLLGVLIYHIIKKTCSCKNTVEGQGQELMKGLKSLDFFHLGGNKPKPVGPGGTEKVPSPSPSPPPKKEIILNEGFNDILKQMETIIGKGDLNKNVNFKNFIDRLPKIVSNSVKFPTSIYKIKNLSEIGLSENSDILDAFELFLIKFNAMPDDELFKNINANVFNNIKDETCSDQINMHIMAFFVTLYTNKTLTGNMDGNTYSNVITISNRLTKYIPDLLEKIQNMLNKNCLDQVNYDSLKEDVLSKIYSTLLQNNVTNISFTGLDQIGKKLENVKTIYIILFMVCLTFIIVKFMGMFTMKLNI